MRYIAEQDGQDPLDNEDYAVIEGMVVATGQINVLELAHIIPKNLLPLIETLAKIKGVSKLNNGIYSIPQGIFPDAADLIRHLKLLVANRTPWPKLPLAKPKREFGKWSDNHFAIGNCVLDIFLLGAATSGNGYWILAAVFAYIIGHIFMLGVPAKLSARKQRRLYNALEKLEHFFFTHDNCATVWELKQVSSLPKRHVLEALISGRHKYFYLPQIEALILAKGSLASQKLEQAKVDVIWGMLTLEKRIDFKLTTERLNVSKYKLLRAIFPILGKIPFQFRFTKNGFEILEEKELNQFITALNDAFLTW